VSPLPARSRLGHIALGLLVVGLVTGPAGWLVTDALESRNDFCNACHLEPGVVLHAQIREDFDAQPVVNLASLHAAAGLGPGAGPGESGGAASDREFRCIDCHGGVGLLGKARTKVLAAKDAFWYVVGHFDEPDGMAWPLREEDCRQCHASFDPPDPEATDPAFHALGLHNVELGVGCVACHQTHGTGGLEDLYYLHPSTVRRECARCHSEYETGD